MLPIYEPRRDDVNMAWLRETAIKIQRRETTFKEAAKNIHFDSIFGIKIEERSISTLKRMFRDNNITVCPKFNKGVCKQTQNLQQILDIYSDLHVGKNKTYEICKSEGIEISKYQINQIYKEYIWTQTIQSKDVRPRCRYQISVVNGAWHGDIHYLYCKGEFKYIFALIDDRSRYIVGYKIMNNKTSKNVKEVFNLSVKKYCTPLAFWCDNGGENTAMLMQKFLEKNDIKLINTAVFSPQSNGKIERFWPEIDRRTKFCQNWDEVEKTIDSFIEYYNNRIPHFGLEKENGIHKTPAKVFFDERLQATVIEEAEIIIDGKHIKLLDFIRKSNN